LAVVLWGLWLAPLGSGVLAQEPLERADQPPIGQPTVGPSAEPTEPAPTAAAPASRGDTEDPAASASDDPSTDAPTDAAASERTATDAAASERTATVAPADGDRTDPGAADGEPSRPGRAADDAMPGDAPDPDNAGATGAAGTDTAETDTAETDTAETDAADADGAEADAAETDGSVTDGSEAPASAPADASATASGLPPLAEQLRACHARFSEFALAMATTREALDTCRLDRVEQENDVARLEREAETLRAEVAAARAALDDALCANPLTTCPGMDRRMPPAGEAFETYLPSVERERLQSDLAVLGFYDGRIDGVVGSRTRDAIADFQAAIGDTADGRIDNRLMVRIHREALLLMLGLRLHPPAFSDIPVALPTEVEDLLERGRTALAAADPPSETALDVARFWFTVAARRGAPEGYVALAGLLRAHAGGSLDDEIAEVLMRAARAAGFEPAEDPADDGRQEDTPGDDAPDDAPDNAPDDAPAEADPA
jgi:peptidoglycan hydrolase-like protein with peptidoglycan-binding domain